jgi:hypothetical protein
MKNRDKRQKRKRDMLKDYIKSRLKVILQTCAKMKATI